MSDNNLNEYDNLEDLENHEMSKKLPLGWVILFAGLIVFGVYYFVSFTPSISGWTQMQAFEESIK